MYKKEGMLHFLQDIETENDILIYIKIKLVFQIDTDYFTLLVKR